MIAAQITALFAIFVHSTVCPTIRLSFANIEEKDANNSERSTEKHSHNNEISFILTT